MNRLLFLFFLLTVPLGGEAFYSPTKQQVACETLEVIKYNLKAKGTDLHYRELFDKAIEEEKIGFIGYHGDSLSFLIYQDIIKVVVEEVLGLDVRKDFHFFAPPLQRRGEPESLMELSLHFKKEGYLARKVLKATFPLNFSLYSNHSNSGWNSVQHFSLGGKEESKLKRRELSLFFERAGIDPEVIGDLYQLAYQHLDDKAGVLLQLFDLSQDPYAFINGEAYPSRPNGFIAENRQVGSYFMECSSSSFPEELRLFLSLKGTLNPGSPLSIKRYTKIQPGKLKAWETDLRRVIRALPVNREARENLKLELESAFGAH